MAGRIAVLGGGPAGATAAEQLARAGRDVVLLDERMAWEKPCGGGLTFKAYQQYQYLLENDRPKQFVTETALSAPRAGKTVLELDRPLLIYSRQELNQLLLDRAAEAGAALVQARVRGVERDGAGWRVQTSVGEMAADFCVVAMGARNPLSGYGTEWKGNTMTALGYFVPGEYGRRIDLQFVAGLGGYIWVFPRPGHLSVGICGRGMTAQQMRKTLEQYMEEHGYPVAGSRFYGHVLPSLTADDWAANRTGGPGWVAAGDAAGMVDPITGEGIYYALRSGELAAEAVVGGGDVAGTYRAALEAEFFPELTRAAGLSGRVYGGQLLGGAVVDRMVQFTRWSPKFAVVVRDLFAGTQDYLGLKARLKGMIGGIAWDVVGHPWRG